MRISYLGALPTPRYEMNVERLLAVLSRLLQPTDKSRLVKQLNGITEALQAVVNEPNNSTHRQQLSERLTAFETTNADERIEKFSIVERETIAEFELEDLIGAPLAQRISQIVQSNAATLDVALKGVSSIRDQVVKDIEALKQIRAGLNHFGLSEDTVDEKSAALSFLIPREDESVAIPSLVADLKDFDLIARAFELLVTGRQSPAKVSSLASSDFSITLDTTIEIGFAIALALQWIIDRYQAVLTLRKTQVELKRLKAEDAAKSVEETISTRIDALADDVTAELVRRFNAKSSGSDLASPLRKAVEKLTKKIDAHYRVEVRVADAPAQDDAASDSDDGVKRVEELRQEIRELNTSIRYFRASEAPIYLIGTDEDSEER